MQAWHPRVHEFLTSPEGISLLSNVEHAYHNETIYPALEHIFYAYECASFDDVHVIILGQDPYHQPGQAHGLAFSVPDNISLPPSLRNIFKEIYTKDTVPTSGDLSYLSHQGVLLINTYLTVPHGKALGHKDIGWQAFTELIINILSQEKKHLVFLLWGAHAQSFIHHIHQKDKHLILTTTHPSPLSAHRGFIGCNHFALANEYLRKHHKKEIVWKKKTQT